MSRKLSMAGLVGLEELAATVRTGDDGAPADVATVTRLTPDGDQVVVHLPLSSIKPNPHQPRRAFDPRTLQDLANSIAEHGRVLQPILVRPAENATDDDPAAFEVVAGERRWRASELAGLSSIRAIVDGVDNATSAEMALAENMARDDLNPLEEARGCAALRDSFGMSVAEIGRRVGRDRTAISHLIRLLDLPDTAQELIAGRALSEGHGRVLLRLGDFGDQANLARRCADAGWSVRELERHVDAHGAGVTATTKRPADQVAALGALTERLTPLFGPSPIKVVPRRHGSYEIQVHFRDLETLRSTVMRLCERPSDAA